MQKIFNLDKWSRLSEGERLEFSNPRPRRVRVEVNAPARSLLYAVDSEGEAHFVATVERRETVEFNTTGAFSLTISGPDILIYTADGDDVSMKSLAPVIFTKIAERRPRNIEMEMLAYHMRREMEARLEQSAREIEDRIAARSGSGAPFHRDQGVPRAPEPGTTSPAHGGDAAGPRIEGSATGADAGAPGSADAGEISGGNS